jgi:hypothetical protein
MFETADDAAVVAAISESARAEAMASARRLDAIAELTGRRCDTADERAHWACDNWDSTAAEVAAALGISHRKASSQMQLGINLRHRLPKVAALFAEGKVSYPVVSAISWHTHLVEDGRPIARIDAELARRAARWGRLSDYKLAQSIDLWVGMHDPGALRRAKARLRSRWFEVGERYDDSDVTSVRGRLLATDAALLDRRLTEMMRAVCESDPRTVEQRRADALGALGAGAERLACQCGDDGCAGAGDDRRASSVVIHVVAEAAALETQPDPETSGRHRTAQRNSEPEPKPKSLAGLLLRGGTVPTPLLAELIRSGAKVREVRRPGDAPEPGYRPSTALDEYVRVRDLTCRFPECDEPAQYCDLDHTIPYPTGPTHASNLKCLCRKHHLLKTFWTGLRGWTDRQLPNGSVVWASPTGQTYTTLPGSRIFFPNWDTTTAEVTLQQGLSPQVGQRGLFMPRRRRTRASDRARRIQEERALNAELVAERNRPPPF